MSVASALGAHTIARSPLNRKGCDMEPQPLHNDTEVMQRFMRREPGAAGGMHSDGHALYAEGQLIAEWDDLGIRILPQPADPANERLKDRLTELVLLQMQKQSLLRHLLRPRACTSLMNGMSAH